MITGKIKFKIISSSSRSCTSEYTRKWTLMYCVTDNISGLNDWNGVLIILISNRERSWMLWISTVLGCRTWAPRVKPNKTWLCSHLVPAHGARVQYSLGSNVNTPFLWVPTPVLPFFIRKLKWTPDASEAIAVLSPRALKYAHRFEMASDKEKWGNMSVVTYKLPQVWT